MQVLGGRPWVARSATGYHESRAATAALVSRLERSLTRVRSKLAFLAGLLHEVGKLYILMRAKDDREVLADETGFSRCSRRGTRVWVAPSSRARLLTLAFGV